MRFERGNHTLQPTALVNEAYLRLGGGPASMWQDRPRVLGTAADVMRNLLVDYARPHNAGKRGDGQIQVTLIEDMVSGDTYRETQLDNGPCMAPPAAVAMNST
jgi:hypothetical protein